MSPEIIKILITAILLLHGIAFGRAAITLLIVAIGHRAGDWIPMRSWLFPSLSTRVASLIALFFWLPSAIGFLAAAWSFWSTSLSFGSWRQLAIVSAIISTLGIALFSGIWPGAPSRRLSSIDTIIALVVNLAIFVCLLWIQWPPLAMFGK
jgi:hypothetical protein